MLPLDIRNSAGENLMPNSIYPNAFKLLALSMVLVTTASAHAEPTGAAVATLANTADTAPATVEAAQIAGGAQPSDAARSADGKTPPAGVQPQGFSFGASQGSGSIGSDGLSPGRQAASNTGGPAPVIVPSVASRANEISWSGSDGDDVCEREKSCQPQSTKPAHQRSTPRTRLPRKP